MAADRRRCCGHRCAGCLEWQWHGSWVGFLICLRAPLARSAAARSLTSGFGLTCVAMTPRCACCWHSLPDTHDSSTCSALVAGIGLG
jgi:hypothetical protein